jgi:DNA-binding NarL/FixJ family response regulator
LIGAGAYPSGQICGGFTRECAVAPIRLVLATMPPILSEIVRETLAGERDIEILAEVADADQLAAAVRRTGASVAVVGIATNRTRALVHELLAEHPRLRVVALASDGRTGYVHSLQPRESAITDISPRTLVAAIRTPRPAKDVHPRLHPLSAD